MADLLKQIGCALVLAAMLGSCSGADIENVVLGAAKSWCRLHSPQYCSVNDERSDEPAVTSLTAHCSGT